MGKPCLHRRPFESGLRVGWGGGHGGGKALLVSTSFPILSSPRPVLRCVLGFSTNHYDCPIPTLSGSCGSGVTCSYRSSPPPPPSPPPEPLGTKLTKPTEDSGSSSSLSGGAIAALVCGGVAVFVLLVLLVLRFRRQSVQLGKMQAPRHRLRPRPLALPSPFPPRLLYSLAHAPSLHTPSPPRTFGRWSSLSWVQGATMTSSPPPSTRVARRRHCRLAPMRELVFTTPCTGKRDAGIIPLRETLEAKLSVRVLL